MPPGFTVLFCTPHAQFPHDLQRTVRHPPTSPISLRLNSIPLLRVFKSFLCPKTLAEEEVLCGADWVLCPVVHDVFSSDVSPPCAHRPTHRSHPLKHKLILTIPSRCVVFHFLSSALLQELMSFLTPETKQVRYDFSNHSKRVLLDALACSALLHVECRMLYCRNSCGF